MNEEATPVHRPPPGDPNLSGSNNPKFRLPQQPTRAPRNKVVAGSAGALGGGELARLIIFAYPQLPWDVALTLAILIITAISFLSAYFTPQEQNS